MMLQLFATSLIFSNAFVLDSVEDAVFAVPPSFGSYDLHKKVDDPHFFPLIDLEETCFSSDMQFDSAMVSYKTGYSEEFLSCADAFEMHESMYSIEVCNVAYPINDEQHSLVNRCGKTFCSKCAQVKDIVAKEVYEEDMGVVFAPGFELFGTEGKESQIVIGMAPPMGVIDDADLPSLPVPDFEPVTLPQNIDPIVASMPAPAFPKMDVVGMEAPVFQDTANEATLEAPMNENTSMVPPGLEKKARLVKSDSSKERKYLNLHSFFESRYSGSEL